MAGIFEECLYFYAGFVSINIYLDKLKVKRMKKAGFRRPAIKTGLGIWKYYISTMTYAQIANYIKWPDELYTSQKLSHMVQKSIAFTNKKAICEYIETEKERFFNSLVLAVYGGEPQWYEGVFEQEGEEFYNIGVLEFTGEEKIFPVDGQHRVAAIKQIVGKGEKKLYEEVPVIFIAHEDSDEGRKRTRRLFTTLNRYAKPVSLSDIIALDEDDIAAIVTRRLVEEASLFSDHRISIGRSESISKNDNTSFTAIITLYKCNEYLLKSYLYDKGIGEKIEIFKRYRKPETMIKDFYQYVLKFWKLLSEKIEDISLYLKDEKSSAEKYRNSEGGNLLFRPAGLKAYVDAVSEIHRKRNSSFERILSKLSSLNLDLNVSPWKKVLWDDVRKSMIMNNKQLMKEFLFYNYDRHWTDSKGGIGLTAKEKH